MSEPVCPICYEDVTSSTGSVNLSCSHTFHLSCITKWFSKQDHGSCPCCRKEVGEKEDLASLTDDEEDDTLTYVSNEPSSLDGEYLSTVALNRQQVSSLIKEFAAEYYEEEDKEVSEGQWAIYYSSKYHLREIRDGETCIRFTYDELNTIISLQYDGNITRERWNMLLKQQLDTVSFNHQELNELENELSICGFTPAWVWDRHIVNNERYIKGEPRYKGETRICFTYAQLSCHLITKCYANLTWAKWKELVEKEINDRDNNWIRYITVDKEEEVEDIVRHVRRVMMRSMSKEYRSLEEYSLEDDNNWIINITV